MTYWNPQDQQRIVWPPKLTAAAAAAGAKVRTLATAVTNLANALR